MPSVLSSDFQHRPEHRCRRVAESALPGAAFEHEREMQLSAIPRARDQLLQTAARLMRRALFTRA